MLRRAVFASVALRHLYTSENMGMENNSDYILVFDIHTGQFTTS